MAPQLLAGFQVRAQGLGLDKVVDIRLRTPGCGVNAKIVLVIGLCPPALSPVPGKVGAMAKGNPHCVMGSRGKLLKKLGVSI